MSTVRSPRAGLRRPATVDQPNHVLLAHTPVLSPSRQSPRRAADEAEHFPAYADTAALGDTGNAAFDGCASSSVLQTLPHAHSCVL